MKTIPRTVESVGLLLRTSLKGISPFLVMPVKKKKRRKKRETRLADNHLAVDSTKTTMSTQPRSFPTLISPSTPRPDLNPFRVLCVTNSSTLTRPGCHLRPTSRTLSILTLRLWLPCKMRKVVWWTGKMRGS